MSRVQVKNQTQTKLPSLEDNTMTTSKNGADPRIHTEPAAVTDPRTGRHAGPISTASREASTLNRVSQGHGSMRAEAHMETLLETGVVLQAPPRLATWGQHVAHSHGRRRLS